MRNTIDWSYALLDAGQQALFARLGVFVGGRTLEAAEAVCTADGELRIDVVDGIAALLDHSLVRQDAGLDDEPRVTMLETLREYALEQLEARGEADALRARHATHYAAFPEQVERALWSTQHQRGMQALEREHHNLVAALAWSLSAPDRHALGVHLAAALGRWWYERAYNDEAHTWLERVLSNGQAAGAATVDYAQALYWSGKHAAMQYDPVFAMQRYQQSLALAQTLQDPDRSNVLRMELGRPARDVGDYARAEALELEALAHFRARADSANILLTCVSLGDVALDQGDVTHATRYYRESFALAQALNDAVGIGAGLIQYSIPSRLISAVLSPTAP